MIFNIRGTSGSGKSHIIHRFLNDYLNIPCPEITGAKTKIESYYLPELRVRILGRYQAICGGCDQIPYQVQVCEKIERLKHPNLIFEGLLISHSFKRYHLLAKKVGPIIFCFFKTSPEQCIERVYKRRAIKGKTGVFNEGQIHKDWASVDRCRQKFLEAGHTVYELDSENSVEEFIEIYHKHKEISDTPCDETSI